MSGVRDYWGLACPECGDDDSLHITAETQTLLLADGSETSGDEQWSSESLCMCKVCGYSARVIDFEIPDET